MGTSAFMDDNRLAIYHNFIPSMYVQLEVIHYFPQMMSHIPEKTAAWDGDRQTWHSIGLSARNTRGVHSAVMLTTLNTRRVARDINASSPNHMKMNFEDHS